MTLVEMVVTLGLMTFIMGGIVVFLVTHSRMTAGSFDRGDIQRSGRGALTILEERIGNAGLGLPKTLAIKAYTDPSGDACAQLPRLEIAAVSYLKQWKVSGTTTTAINLAAFTADNPSPGGTAADIAVTTGQWLFIYASQSMDLYNPGGAFGSNRGLGMVRASGNKAKGATSIPVTTANTNYSAAQLSLDLAATAEINQGTERSPVVMPAEVSGFGVGCENPNQPYLYWENNGDRVPVASTVATPAIGGVVGLEFRFVFDLTGPGGRPDGQPDTDSDSVAMLIDPNPAVGNQDNVLAVEVTVRLRSARPDPQLDAYRVETFTLLIQTPSIHTAVGPADLSHLGKFIFVENTGI